MLWWSCEGTTVKYVDYMGKMSVWFEDFCSIMVQDWVM